MQALLRETRRLRGENEVLRIQVSSSSPPRSRQPRSQRTNSRQSEKVMYPGNVEFPCNEQEIQPEERSPPACHAQQDESSDFTHISATKRRDRKSQLSDAMRTRLGPQMPGAGGKPHVATAQEACLGPSTAPAITNWIPHPPVQQPVGDLINRGPLALSASDWTTCFPCLSALTSSTTILQESSWSRNSLHMMEPAIHLTTSCTTSNS